jgi:hypothetical protein
MSEPVPTRPGFYWAKWLKADPGTDACGKCGHEWSEWEKEIVGERWGPVEVVVNCNNPKHPEYLMAQIGGVARWQSLGNFEWGPVIHQPEDLGEHCHFCNREHGQSHTENCPVREFEGEYVA